MNRRSFFRSTAAIIIAAAVPIDLVVRPTFDDLIRDMMIEGLEYLHRQNQPLFPSIVGVVEPGTPAGEVIEMIIKPYMDEPTEENHA